MPIKIFQNMKRIVVLYLCFFSVIIANAQINSSTTQAVDCNNITGSISLDANITYPSTIIWEHESNGLWTNVNTVSFVTLNSTQDTLYTTQCGLYRVSFYYNNLGSPTIETDSFSISCPLTIGQGQEPILCYGDSSGTLKRPVFGGTPFNPNNSVIPDGDEYYFYTWYYADDALGTNSVLLNDTTQNLVGIPAGWYKSVVTDAQGCTDSINFVQFKNPQEFRADTVLVESNNCIGDTSGSIFLRVRGGKKMTLQNKYFYYLTLNNDTIAFSDVSGFSSNFSYLSLSINMQGFYPDSILINNLIAGDYVFSAVDSNGCIMQDTITVNEPEPYTAYTSTMNPLICASDTVGFIIDSITGGNSIFNYSFIGFSDDDTIYVAAGVYDVSIKDLQYGCNDTISVSCIAQVELETIEIINHIICNGDTTGSISIDSIYGGYPPYNVQWGGVNPQYLGAGMYTAYITDSLGCILINEYEVQQPDEFLANPVYYSPSCNGLADGAIKINVTGGVGQLSYYWLNGTGVVDSIYGLSAGVYSLVVSDSYSCKDTIHLTLNEPEELTFSFENYTSPLVCSGALTSVDVLISGGTGPYTINWSDGNNDAQRVLSSGNYSCYIKDGNSCTTSSFPLIIEEPTPFVIQNVDVIDPTCDAGGEATINIYGGTEPYTYLWSTGETSQSINSLNQENYWVIATDSCGASDTAFFTLNTYELVTALLYDDVTHVGEVVVDISTTGGPFSYEWTDVVGNVISTDSVTSNLCEGTYFVATTDISTNCTNLDTLDATYYLPNGIVDVSTTTVLPDSDLWGNPPYTYLWSNGVVFAHANICPGSHWVEVTDVDGCVIREGVDIDPLVITLDPASAIVECNLENLDVELTADVIGGTAPYTYSWSNGSTDSYIDLNLNPGTYSVAIMDNNACVEDTSFVIATMSAECIPNVFTPNGDNINDTWNLEDTFLYSDSEVRVYGRFGKLLFKSVGYSVPWDGKNEKGNDVKEGVYFYSIEIGHGFDPINGSVTIVR